MGVAMMFGVGLFLVDGWTRVDPLDARPWGPLSPWTAPASKSYASRIVLGR